MSGAKVTDRHRELARKWIETWLAMPGVVPCNATAREEEFEQLLADYEREVRLDEAKWWEEHGADREGDLSDAGRERLIELRGA